VHDEQLRFYVYCLDADFGPFFLKFSTHFPYTAKLYINGERKPAAQDLSGHLDAAAEAGVSAAVYVHDSASPGTNEPSTLARIRGS
jgi:hypothetical protein